MSDRGRFPHESLDAYRVALDVVRAVQALEFARGQAWLKDQLVRSSGSVVLNIAEAYGRAGAARKNHLRIASGSAAETCAGLDILGGQPDLQEKCRRVGIMLWKLTRC